MQKIKSELKDIVIYMAYNYDYARPALTVDAIVIARQNSKFLILLIERKNEPFKGMWALPGGFINMDETLLEACKRELKEETGISDIDLYEFHCFDAIDRDPRERTISTVFYGFVNDILLLSEGDDAADAKWFPINSLPELAFDHKEIFEGFMREKLQI